MALVHKNRVQETSTTTGTGTYTLDGAVTGFQTFAAIGNANTCYYCATDGVDWEVGLGTYTSSGTTLARTSVLASTNADAAVNWAAGTRRIFVVYPASQTVTLGGTETLTNKTLTDPALVGTILEDVYTISDGAAFEIDPGNGSIQLVTLGANRTPAATNFAAGESITLLVADGTAYTITWSTVGVVWVGGVAPTLATSGYSVIELWKISSTIYGAHVGDVA